MLAKSQGSLFPQCFNHNHYQSDRNYPSFFLRVFRRVFSLLINQSKSRKLWFGTTETHITLNLIMYFPQVWLLPKEKRREEKKMCFLLRIFVMEVDKQVLKRNKETLGREWNGYFLLASYGDWHLTSKRPLKQSEP